MPPDTQILVAALSGVTLILALVLWDLSRHEVRHLPKWAWALIVVLVSFPIGAILYVVVGRVPAGEIPPARTAARPASASRPGLADADPPSGRGLADLAPADGPTRPPSGHGETVVRTHGLGKLYGATVALDGVDLAVPRGSVYGLIGPNGAGKTTLFSILADLRRATSGSFDLSMGRRAVAVLPDNPPVRALADRTGRGRRGRARAAGAGPGPPAGVVDAQPAAHRRRADGRRRAVTRRHRAWRARHGSATMTGDRTGR